MITLITGGQSIQRKALMSSLTASMPTHCTSQFTYFDEDFYNKLIEWCFEDFNDVYFLLDDKETSFYTLTGHCTPEFKFIDKHFHIVETMDSLFVYEFDQLTKDLYNAHTLRNGKKYVFNPNYAHVALQPYINNKLFKNFKTLCFIVFVSTLLYSIYAILFIKNFQPHVINALYISVFCASILMAFSTFQRVAYE